MEGSVSRALQHSLQSGRVLEMLQALILWVQSFRSASSSRVLQVGGLGLFGVYEVHIKTYDTGFPLVIGSCRA